MRLFMWRRFWAVPSNTGMVKDLSTQGARIDIADARGQTPKDLTQVEEFRAKTEFAYAFPPMHFCKAHFFRPD